VVCTLWRTEADAQRYESSGQAQEIVGMVRRTSPGRRRCERTWSGASMVDR
jgi:hypothetical protein